MSKKPLSKQIGLWDNATKKSENQQIKNSIGEIERCFNKDSYLKKLIDENKLEINIRGSFSKRTDITQASDLDLHLVFSKEFDLKKKKNYVENTLKKYFGGEYVERKNLVITIEKNDNRVTTDILICKKTDDNHEIKALDDNNGEFVLFYPEIDEDNINKLNATCNDLYSKMVRAFKGLKNEIYEAKSSSIYITSSMIECLLYNVNHSLYKDMDKYEKEQCEEQKYRKMFVDVKNTLFSAQLANYSTSKDYYEINGKKYLFKDENDWEDARNFFNNVNSYLSENYEINE